MSETVFPRRFRGGTRRGGRAGPRAGTDQAVGDPWEWAASGGTRGGRGGRSGARDGGTVLLPLEMLLSCPLLYAQGSDSPGQEDSAVSSCGQDCRPSRASWAGRSFMGSQGALQCGLRDQQQQPLEDDSFQAGTGTTFPSSDRGRDIARDRKGSAVWREDAVNNPIPSNLKSEAKKAAKILREFTEITSRNGPDKIIPAHVIAKAKGLAILSVIKAGFLVTARGGSGVVLARLPDGKWSAPSAIGIAGLGGGFEVGIEVSDLVIILNYDRAVEAFAKGGNLTLGGNFTVAVGPLGRNLEGNVALRSPAAVFTYCKSRGLFAGVSLEGSCLIERKDTNRKFYCRDVRAYDILFGETPRPAQADDLYEILDSFAAKYERDGQRANARRAAQERRRPAARDLPPKPLPSPRPTPARAPLDAGSQSNGNKSKLYPELSSFQERVGLPEPLEVTALYSFEGQQPGDLNFQAGDRITVISKTDSQFDWWEGKLRGQTGIFPANYVAVN
ncbi:SH3 domain-containing YSC84-like protein 1 [Enhydra lutris kenyoni]|uniref:SH3 domain-containing YSC84-like protein 1 n=1 Tax=Enhydra lutris kenyoni TaxID=391180 RepID=A0A2Y9K844_ENHLU|nr:SH3 domain-containing YSC84-like protein 1 [Enhydra lutris kenyoni]